MQSKVLFGLAAATTLFGACEASDGGQEPSAEAGAAGEASAGQATGASSSGGASGNAGSAHAGSSVGGVDAAGAGVGGVAEGGRDATGGEGGEAVGGEGGEGGEAVGGEGGEVNAVAYVSTVQGSLLLASLDPRTFVPSLLPSSPIHVDGSLHGVAVNHTGKFLFVAAEPARIDTYSIAADGSLPEEPSASAPVDDENPMLSVALDPRSRFAYGVSPFSHSIYVFKINAQTGALTPSGDPLLVGPAPDHRRPAFVGPEPSGRYVYVTQMADGAPADNGIRGYSVNQDTGELTELNDSPFNEGDVVAGAIVFRPDGKFLFSAGGALNAFEIAPESGNLTLVEGSPFSTDIASDPWAPNITIDPQGKRLYASNFLPTQHISGFSIDQATGALTELPGSPVTSIAPYSIALGPNGRALYVGNDTGQLSVFRVASNGGLTSLEGSPFAMGGLEPDITFVTLP